MSGTGIFDGDWKGIANNATWFLKSNITGHFNNARSLGGITRPGSLGIISAYPDIAYLFGISGGRTPVR